MPFSSIWPAPDENWNFDVSSLMVLIGEGEELEHRLSQRSFAQCIVAAPVVGLQGYIRSYDLLLTEGALTIYSPHGCSTGPLRNLQLEYAIRSNMLLADGKLTVYQIPKAPNTPSRQNKYRIVLTFWLGFTWICFGGIIAFSLLAPDTTWIGLSNALTMTLWSILIRVIEYFNIKPTPVDRSHLPNPQDMGAVFILGRTNSAFVLEGTREQIKDWTTRGLSYQTKSPRLGKLLQAFTRLFSLFVLLSIFATIPNGHTMDQVAFVILNALAQANTVFSKWLQHRALFAELILLEDTSVASRTHVYGSLIRRYADLNRANGWLNVLGLLPRTPVWDEWSKRFAEDVMQEPKQLYNKIDGEFSLMK